MKPLQQMTRQEVSATVRTLATGFAARDYERQHPGCHWRAAWGWAGRHWQEYKPRAIDAVIAVQVVRYG